MKNEKFDTVKNPEPVTYTAEELAAAGLAAVTEEAKPQPETVSAAQQPAEGAKPKPRDTVSVRSGGEIRPLIPTSLDEVYRFAKMMAMTFNLPVAYYEEPKKEIVGTIEYSKIEVATMRAIHAIQLGAEVGIPPAQAIQSILVLNGIGTIWGDAQLGLVLASGQCESYREYTEGGEMWEEYDKANKTASVPNREYTWVFETKRKGRLPAEPVKFSIGDAIHAGIWGKKTWATHPGRMGKYKARAFSLRDNYPDVLKGLCHSREEMEGEMLDVTPRGSMTTPHNAGADMNKLLEQSADVIMPAMQKTPEYVAQPKSARKS